MNKITSNVQIYCTMYNLSKTKDDTETRFFYLVENYASILKLESNCISLQLYSSGVQSQSYIILEFWPSLVNNNRYYYIDNFHQSIYGCIGADIIITPLKLASNTIINQPHNPFEVTYYPNNAIECSVLNLIGIDNVSYLPNEDIWTKGLECYSDAAQSKQVWFNPNNENQVTITIIWCSYTQWKEFPLHLIGLIDAQSRENISPAKYIYDAYDCYSIKNFV